MDELTRLLWHCAFSIGLFAVLYPAVVLVRHWAHQHTGRPRVVASPFLAVYQTLALLRKRGDTPGQTDALVHKLTPVVGLFPLLFAVALLPTSDIAPVTDATPALVLGIMVLTSAAVALAGQSSGNPLGRLDGLRLLTLRTSVLAVVFVATMGIGAAFSTQSLGQIVSRQWMPMSMGAPTLGVLINPLGLVAVIMAIAIFAKRAERQRTDQNRELIDNYSIGASGPTLLFHQFLRTGDRIAVAAVCAVIFLGGASSMNTLADVGTIDALQVLTAFAEVALKTAGIAGAVLLAERALPPLHHDQAIRLVWGALLPLAAVGAVLSPVVLNALR